MVKSLLGGNGRGVQSQRAHRRIFAVAVATALLATLLPWSFVPASAQTSAPPIVSGLAAIGLDLEASRLDVSGARDPGDSTSIPPDTMGAVGPNHIVEMINGNYEIFDKGTGATLEEDTLDNFFTNKAGLAQINNRRFDPRIVYDPVSERWFASAIDNVIDTDGNNVNEQSNNIFVARSDSDDPTGDWDGVGFDADTVGAEEFHDFDTFGLDADGVYLCTQDFDGAPGTNESCYSIPKADLLQATPSAANLSRFEDTPPTIEQAWQPAVDFGTSDGRAPLLGSNGTALQRLDITGASSGGAAISPAMIPIAGDPGHAAPPGQARQPDDSDAADGIETLENSGAEFGGNVFELGNSLWAVHAVAGGGGNSALQWYEINESTNTVIQSGLIEDATRDFMYPTIAANENGDVVIGYSCTGPTLPASVCVSLGTTSAGSTAFQAPTILMTGVGTYYRDFCDPTTSTCNERNRWGDYSATVIDPVDPCSFWTFQEYTAVDAGATDVGPGEAEGGLWGVRATELTFIDCAGATDLTLDKEAPPSVAAGEQLTYTNTVRNVGGDMATNVVVTDELPAGVEVVSTAPACTQAGQTLTCPLGGMLPNQERTVSIVVRVPADHLSSTGSTEQTIVNTASVDSDQFDRHPGDNSDEAATTIVERADMAVSKLCRVDSANAAAIAGTCDIFVDNIGPSDAQNVVMRDNISSSSPFTVTAVTVDPAASGTCTVTPSAAVPSTSKEVNCTLGTEPAGDRTTVTVSVSAPGGADVADQATVTSSTPDDNPDNNDASGALTLSPRADLVISKSATPADPIAGETVTYDINVRNEGPSPANNVVVMDELPAPVTFISATSSQGQCGPDSSNSTIRCQLGTIASGGSVPIEVLVRVPSDTIDGTVLANRAIATSDTPDPDNSDNEAVAPVQVRAVSDLSLVKTSEGTPIAGTLITYRYTISNAGPSWAQDVALVDQLPAGMTFSAAFLGVGGGDVEPLACDEIAEGTNKFSCPLGDVAPTASEPLEVVMNVLINPDVLEGTNLTNQAKVVSDTVDSDDGNNLDSVSLIIQTLADLEIVKTSDFDTYGPSATIKYTITVANHGPSDSQAVVVFDDLPTTKQAIYRFDTANCTQPDTLLLRCELGRIRAGEAKEFNVYVTVKGNKGEVVNTARIIDPPVTQDPDGTNNTSVRTVLIQGSLHKK